MIILHAGILGNRLMLWGETDAALSAPHRGKTASIRFRYDPENASLLEAVSKILPAFKTNERSSKQLIAWLPTIHGKVLASSPLIDEPPASARGRKVTLAPWSVTGIPLETEEAVNLLCLSMNQTTLAPGLVVGSDLAYWATVCRYAGRLVAREQFLPGVVERDGAYRSAWQPVFSIQETYSLSQAMPHACRALTDHSDEVIGSPPAVPAISLLKVFVSQIVDWLVRSAADSKNLDASKSGPGRARGSFDSLHDQWLYSLTTPEGKLHGSLNELQELSLQVREWRRPLALSTSSAFRLCFRLEEPAPADESTSTQDRISIPDDNWYVRYMLQAVDDLSLQLPVAEAWRPKARTENMLGRNGFDAREYLLLALGQASRLNPHIEESLKSASPGGYQLNTSEALEFLTEKAWLLEQAGFGILLPNWWSRKGTRSRLTARAKVKSPALRGGGGLSLEDIVEFDWEIALGSEKLTLKELEALARLKVPLVKIRGQWVQLNADEIQAALEAWKGKRKGTVRLRDLVGMALGSGDGPGNIALEGVSATGWIADLLSKLEGRASLEELPTPSGFHGTLRPYQLRGYSWLAFLSSWGLGACLADDMGLGKTIEALAFIKRRWESGFNRPTLLVCPMSVVNNWQKEAERFTPDLPVMIHHGLMRQKGDAFRKQAEQQAMVVSSYALLHRDLHLFKDVNWSAFVIDEAQNIKNAETKQARAAREISADCRIALTGTPVENNVGDLWSLMEFLNPGHLGSQAQFKRSFFIPIQVQRDPEAASKLKRLTSPFILRRLKTDKTIIDDLPEKMEMKLFCNLTKEQASLYAAVVEDLGKRLDDAEGIQRKGLVLSTLTRLKQVCNHPAQFLSDNSPIPGRSGKLTRLTEMLEEVLAEGDRALVFTQFAEMGGMIRKHLQETFGREVLFLHGAVPKKQRDRMVESFQSDDERRPFVFILSLKAGGTGLNLTAASHVFHFDRWWNPAVENQATDRAFRIGQKRNVQVHKFICAGTLEEKIDEMIERKQEIASSIVGTGEGWLTELSNDELKELFALRQTVLGTPASPRNKG